MWADCCDMFEDLWDDYDEERQELPPMPVVKKPSAWMRFLGWFGGFDVATQNIINLTAVSVDAAVFL